MTSRAEVACRAVLTVFALGLAGCRPAMPPTYPAQGRVILTTGEPVTQGLVEFESADQAYNARGTIGRDGTFRLRTRDRDGAVAGRHRAIVVQTLSAGIGSMGAKGDPRAPRVEQAHGAHQSEPPRVSARYADYRASQLEFEVRPDLQNDFLIRVEPANP